MWPVMPNAAILQQEMRQLNQDPLNDLETQYHCGVVFVVVMGQFELHSHFSWAVFFSDSYINWPVFLFAEL